MNDRDHYRERHFLHLDGLAFVGEVATELADRAARLEKAAEELGVAEWRAFMRTAPDERELSIGEWCRDIRRHQPIKQEPQHMAENQFNGIRRAS